jgi:pimeloyl-ACP methyl ester carboxylesterase
MADKWRQFAFALGAALCICACTSTTHTSPGMLVRLADGRRLNMNCSGRGSPTVILEGGFAATSEGWDKVQPTIARTTRVCSYDRAGYGLSDPGPAPRDGLAVATDLDHAVQRARIKGPYVLVGHSAGALYMRLFSDLRWKDVVGMVLVDPSVEHQDKRFAARFGPGAGGLGPLRARAIRCLTAAEEGTLPSLDPALAACTPQQTSDHPVDRTQTAQSRLEATFSTEISELDTLWGSTSDEIDAGRKTYGDMPLIVLTADGTYAGAPPAARGAVEALWRSLHQELAARSTRGREQVVARSSHLMMKDRPDAICAAIEEIIAENRDSRFQVHPAVP